MAKTATSLSSACGATDTSIVVASATSVAAGNVLFVDDEQMQVMQSYVSGTTVPVLRGRGGTVTSAHVSGALVSQGLASDFAVPGPGGAPVNLPNVRTRVMTSYVASGAITLPLPGQDAVAEILGTSTLAMTVAAPSQDISGSILYIMATGKSASTVTFASGLGNAGSAYDVVTFQNGGNVGISVMAVGAFWVPLNGPITGTTTALSVAIA